VVGRQEAEERLATLEAEGEEQRLAFEEERTERACRGPSGGGSIGGSMASRKDGGLDAAAARRAPNPKGPTTEGRGGVKL